MSCELLMPNIAHIMRTEDSCIYK